jgi:hypothetical protein
LVPLKFINKEFEPGDTFKPKNEEAIRELLAEVKVRPVAEVMCEKYKKLTEWLHEHTLSADEIKETLPSLYRDIQDAIERLDTAFVNEDLQAFQCALDQIRLLYAEALFKCGWRIGVRVPSEVLQAELWIVADTADMHSLRSQGIAESVYTAEEIGKLREITKDSLKGIHKVRDL